MSKVAADLSVVTSVGLDLAKHVFQVHAVAADGRAIVGKALRRRDVLPFFAALPPCLVGMEASDRCENPSITPQTPKTARWSLCRCRRGAR